MRGTQNIQRLTQVDFIRFCVVGGFGFVLNTAIFSFLYRILHMPAFWSQLIAGEIALFSNFLLHHNWTYKHKNVKKGFLHLLWQFHATSWLAVIGTAALVSIGIHTFNLPYIIALVIAAGLAMLWNFAWSKFVIWRHHEHNTVEEEDAKA